MKKNYFLWTVCAALLSGYGLPQDAYVTGPAKVKVNEKTLVFFGEKLTITEDASDEANVDNLGNIIVVGDYSNAAADSNYTADKQSGKNFINRYADATTYGQLIIDDQRNAGPISMEKDKINTALLEWGQFAIPFDYDDADDATKRLFGLDYFNSNDRYRNSMMVWNNTEQPRFDQLKDFTSIVPGDYVILNLKYESPGIKGLMESAGQNLTHYGKVLNKEITVGFENATGDYYPAGDWEDWKEDKNIYGERYKTYIVDDIAKVDDPDYGKYIYQFGNPYSSNITLAFLNDANVDDGNYFPNLRAVAQAEEALWSRGQGGYDQTFIVATYDEVEDEWGGDAEALLVKPFRPFILMFNSDPGQQVFTFSDKIKTFSMNPLDGAPMYTKKTFLEFDNEFDATYEGTDIADKVAGSVMSTYQPRKMFYQAKFSLYDEDGNTTGNRIFLIVSGGVKNGEPNNLEAEYGGFGNRTGFYLEQENADGSRLITPRRKMHINSISPSFTNKPIPLFFNRDRSDLDGYYLKADLFYGSIFNKLTQDVENFADGNSFFFYDRAKDVLLPVTTDFEYYVKPSMKSLKGSEYELYWNGGGTATRDGMEPELIAGSTVVYKDKDLHMVKFNSLWSSAEVKVYDINGRNVLTHDHVDTSNLLHLQLPVRGVYVVKITADTGEIYTQKIIK